MKKFFTLIFAMFISMGIFADSLSVNLSDNHLNFPSSSYAKDTVTYTDSTGVTITPYCASNGYKFNSYSGSEALLYGKLNAYLVFTAPVTVDSVVVVGVSGASGKVTWNFLVNDSVLASYTGSKETYHVVIPEGLRSDKNTFTTKITNANNAQISCITFYYTGTSTNLSTVKNRNVYRKVMDNNGNLVIMKDNQMYNVFGQKIQ